MNLTRKQKQELDWSYDKDAFIRNQKNKRKKATQNRQRRKTIVKSKRGTY